MRFCFECKLEYDGIVKHVVFEREHKATVRKYVRLWINDEKKMCRRGLYREDGVIKWIMYRRPDNSVAWAKW